MHFGMCQPEDTREDGENRNPNAASHFVPAGTICMGRLIDQRPPIRDVNETQEQNKLKERTQSEDTYDRDETHMAPRTSYRGRVMPRPPHHPCPPNPRGTIAHVTA